MVDADFDSDGHCRVCHLSQQAVARVDQLVLAGQAERLALNTTCGHTMIYRSLGMWTSAIQPATTTRTWQAST